MFAPLPSLITSLSTAEGKEEGHKLKDEQLPCEGAQSDSNVQNIHVVASADWSGCIKLLVNV